MLEERVPKPWTQKDYESLRECSLQYSREAIYRYENFKQNESFIIFSVEKNNMKSKDLKRQSSMNFVLKKGP